MDFTKMQGLGNDFIIVEAISWEEAGKYQVHAEKLCNRFLGIGGDGLVVIGNDSEADVFMRIFNSDGSEAMMCGNGIRCVARYVYEKKLVSGTAFSVRTMSGLKYPVLELDSDSVSQVRVDMGEPVLQNQAIPVNAPGSNLGLEVLLEKGCLTGTAVSMGNPHFVVLVDSIEATPIEAWGSEVEVHRIFPERTNVEFVQVLNSDEMIMRVWERGCGVTQACGTGACASTVAAVLNGKTGRRVTVHLLGGDLLIEWDKDNNRVYMTGPAENVFSGRIELA